jgi:hypothetical protein
MAPAIVKISGESEKRAAVRGRNSSLTAASARDGCQRELELGTTRPAQSQAAEPQDALEMCKQHLNALSVMARSLERLGLGQRPGNVASILLHIAHDPTRGHIRTAFLIGCKIVPIPPD